MATILQMEIRPTGLGTTLKANLNLAVWGGSWGKQLLDQTLERRVKEKQQHHPKKECRELCPRVIKCAMDPHSVIVTTAGHCQGIRDDFTVTSYWFLALVVSCLLRPSPAMSPLWKVARREIQKLSITQNCVKNMCKYNMFTCINI